jgi:hypothetical protein
MALSRDSLLTRTEIRLINKSVPVLSAAMLKRDDVTLGDVLESVPNAADRALYQAAADKLIPHGNVSMKGSGRWSAS